MSRSSPDLRGEFERLLEKVREAERERGAGVERRLEEMRLAMERAAEQRDSVQRQCESRCAAAEAELRSQRGAAERRLAAVEREVGESVNVRQPPPLAPALLAVG